MSLPYFRYFSGDHLKAKVGMTHEQKGIYTDLLEISWEQTPPGTLPNDLAEIARLLGVPLKRFTPQGPIVLRAWKRQGKRLVHDWLQREHMDGMAYHNERSESGRKGNEKRWNKPTVLSLSDRSAITKGSPSSSSSSSLKEKKERERRDGAEHSTHAPASSTPGSLSFSSNEFGKTTVSLESTELQAVYDAYAPHRRGSKTEVMKAWKHAKDRPALDVLLKAIERQRQSKDWVDGVILKLPNWLNQEGWKHQPPPADPAQYCQSSIDGHLCMQKAHKVDRQRWNTNTALASMCKPCHEGWCKTAPNHGRRAIV